MTTKVKDLKINGTSSTPSGNGTTSGVNNGKLRHSSNHQDGTNKSKGRSNGNDQLKNSLQMEGVNEGNNGKKYCRPSKDQKIDAFFNYFKQENARQHDINLLAISLVSKFGNELGTNLFIDCKEFTKDFSMDILTSPKMKVIMVDKEGTVDEFEEIERLDPDYVDISYINNGNTIERYLAPVDNAPVCSLFRHYFDYAMATERETVADLIREKKEKQATERANNALRRREEKETKKVGEKIADMSTEKLLGLLSEDQKNALLAQLMNK